MYYYVPFYYYIKFVVQLLSCVRLSATLWTAAHQASPSFIISQSLLKLMSIKSVMQSNHLILCHSLLLPSIFPSTWGLFQWVSSSHEVAKVLEVQFLCQSFQWTQDWFALGSTGWTSWCPRDSQESFPASQFKSIYFSLLSLLYDSALTSVMTTGETIAFSLWIFMAKWK